MTKKRSFVEYMADEAERVIKPIVKQLYYADVSFYPRGPDKVFALSWNMKDINISTAEFYNNCRDRMFNEEEDISQIDHTKLVPWYTAQPEGACANEIKNEKNYATIQEQIKKTELYILKQCLIDANIELPKKLTKKAAIDLIASVVVGEV